MVANNNNSRFALGLLLNIIYVEINKCYTRDPRCARLNLLKSINFTPLHRIYVIYYKIHEKVHREDCNANSK